MINLAYKFVILFDIIEKSGIQRSKTELISRAVEQFNCQKAFLNTNVNKEEYFQQDHT